MSGLAYPNPAVAAPATSAANQLLVSLPADDLHRLRPHLRSVRLRPKQILHKQGDRIRDVYFPAGGACSIIELTQDGQAVEIATVGDEGLLGGSGVLRRGGIVYAKRRPGARSVGRCVGHRSVQCGDGEEGRAFCPHRHVSPGAHDSGDAKGRLQRTALSRATMLPLASDDTRPDQAR